MKASDYNGVSVLIVDGYARQTLPMAEGFRQLRCKVFTVCFSKLDVGYQTRYSSPILIKCGKENYSEQERIVCNLIRTGQFGIVVPMTDYSAIYLAKNKKELSQYAYIAVNNSDVFELAIDKLKTSKVCAEYKIPSPVTLFSDDPVTEIQRRSINYPVVIKPKTACGSIGFNIADDEEHLKRILSNYDGANGEMFVQEYIPQSGSQYGAEVYRDYKGNVVFSLVYEKPRWYPLDGGAATIIVSVHIDEIKKMAESLLEAINWRGYANLDFVIDSRDGKPKIIEVNARISAVVKLDYCCGINIARLIYNDAFKIESYVDDYKDGIKTSCFLTELLWFVKSPKRFRQKPIFLNRKNTSDVIFSWSDIMPSIAFCLQSVKNYKHAMRMRKRKR